MLTGAGRPITERKTNPDLVMGLQLDRSVRTCQAPSSHLILSSPRSRASCQRWDNSSGAGRRCSPQGPDVRRWRGRGRRLGGRRFSVLSSQFSVSHSRSPEPGDREPRIAGGERGDGDRTLYSGGVYWPEGEIQDGPPEQSRMSLFRRFCHRVGDRDNADVVARGGAARRRRSRNRWS